MYNTLSNQIANAALALAVAVFLFAGYAICFHGHDTTYSYNIQYTTCTGAVRDTTVLGWQNGVEIHNYRVAVPELRMNQTRDHNGYVIALNVCEFKIISQSKK